MKKLLILLLLTSMVLGGCGTKNGTVEAQDTQKAETTYVKIAKVTSIDFRESLSLPGTLKPSEEVVITSKVNGTVDYINVDIGDPILAGETLVKIDDSTYRIQNNQTRAALNMQRINYDDAKKNYERQKVLFEAKAISQVQMEAAEKQYQMAKEQLASAQYSYDLTLKNLKDTNIIAPISGIVSFKDVSVGENIGPNRAIFILVNTNPIYVETGVAERDIGQIKKGQKVVINVETIGAEILQGKVTHIGPVPSQNQAYPLQVLVENPNDLLKVGMVATIEVVIDEHKNALAVPKKAVLTEEGEQYVFVVQDDKALKKQVQLGYSNESFYEIIKGLQKDEKVVVVGNDQLKDGSLVEVK